MAEIMNDFNFGIRYQAGIEGHRHNGLVQHPLCVIIVVVDRCRNYPESNKRTENDDGLPEKSQRNGDTDDVAA